MRTLIIDDEPKAREGLINQIKRHCTSLNIVGEATSVEEGVRAISNNQPDLVFLDVKLLDGSGFDLLDQVKPISFQTVFVTAYDEFAIQAFEYNAVHYLLKPFLPDELIKAVHRAQVATNTSVLNLKNLLHQLHTGKSLDRIAIQAVSKITYVEPNQIIRCESEGSYTHLHLEDGSSILSTKPLKSYEELLLSKGFYRIHKSHLINLSKVNEYLKKSSDQVIMKDGSRIEISRKKRGDFLKVMS